MEPDIAELLLDIKSFLALHMQIEGAFGLLARLDAHLDKNKLNKTISNEMV